MDPEVLSQAFRRAARPRVLYQHRCPLCGAGRTARRPVRRWRCRVCRESGREGELQITTSAYVETKGK
jgi:ribosomal protein L37AE/L43A